MFSFICRAGSLLAMTGCLLTGALQADAASAHWPPAAPQFTISSSWPSNVQGFLRLETSQQLYDVVYHYGQNTPTADGAYGANVSAPRSAWYLEEQRAGGLDVVAGVVRQDPNLIGLGLKMFHFGLAREAANGSFPGQMWPFHDTAMFLAEAAPSLIVLQYSSYANQFSSQVNWEIPRLNRAALHMVRAVGGPGRIDDSTKNHRFYEAALALDATGILAHDKTLHTWSTVYAKLAIGLERPDGVMPEDGGHDTGYQALGMTYAARYMELQAHTLLAGSLYRTLQRGEAWELSRVKPDGYVDQTGDTRTVGCKERNVAGECKTVFYAPIFNAFARWAVISGSARFQQAAHQVWTRQQAA